MHTDNASDGMPVERWYIMIHPKPEIIHMHLSMERQRRKDERETDFTFIIPYLHLNRAEYKEEEEQEDAAAGRGWLRKQEKRKRERSEAENNNSLRNYLRYFVFIKSTRQLIDQLRALRWNTEGLYHLSYRYTYSGDPLCITDEQMQPMLRILALYQHKFSVTDFSPNTFSAGTVLIQEGPLQGSMATVLKVRRHDNGFALTLAVPMFKQEFMVRLDDVDAKTVKVLGGSIDSFLQPYFINQMEKDLVGILRMRVRHTETVGWAKTNQALLDSYANLLTLVFDDPVLQKHFCALQLLHAVLLRDPRLKAFWLEKASSMLHSAEEPSDDEDAFLLAILFVATRKGAYRKAVKAYTQSRSSVLPQLLKLQKIIKEINTR